MPTMPTTQNAAPTLTWERGDTRNEWELWHGDEILASLERQHPTRMSASGPGGLYVADRTKPMTWCLVFHPRDAQGKLRKPVTPCEPGTDARTAKRVAIELVKAELFPQD